jgi:hypothetical protein
MDQIILFYFSRFGSSAAVSKMILRVASVIVFTLYCNCSLLRTALGNFKVQNRLLVRFEKTLKKGTFGAKNNL